MPLEDEFPDIVKKARTGQGLSLEACAAACKVPVPVLQSLESGRIVPTRAQAEDIARVLHLSPQPLVDIAAGTWHPRPSTTPHIETVLGDIDGYPVKGYVLYDEGEAVFVDTAYRAVAMLETLTHLGARLTAVCLTHGHADHADGLDAILKVWPVPVYLGPEDERLLAWHPPRSLLRQPIDGDFLQVGRQRLRFMTT